MPGTVTSILCLCNLAEIFIGYSSKHRELTRALPAAIEAQYGVGSVWWDQALESWDAAVGGEIMLASTQKTVHRPYQSIYLLVEVPAGSNLGGISKKKVPKSVGKVSWLRHLATIYKDWNNWNPPL